MDGIALYPIFGKPLILYLGLITIISFFITATIGFSFYRGLLKKFKLHPTMVVVSFILAIIMAVVGSSIGNPTVGILGILAFSSFLITAIIGLSIHHRLLKIRFIWHPVMASISLILAVIHGTYAIIIFS